MYCPSGFLYILMYMITSYRFDYSIGQIILIKLLNSTKSQQIRQKVYTLPILNLSFTLITSKQLQRSRIYLSQIIKQLMKQRQGLDSSYLNGNFDRQVRINDWDQKLLQKQTILIMGVGGLGSVVMMSMLRLGVKKIFIVDYDVVDNHNMNRQLMYSVKDIGKNKIECATKNAEFHNVGGTLIQGFHGDALLNWKKITHFAQESDIVFNCIDHGDKFDVAVTALCLRLKKPLIMGGTFATSLTVDYFGPEGVPCFLCTNDQAANQKQLIDKIMPSKILDYDDISFLPKNNNPIGRSSTIVCTICGQFMVSQFINQLFLSQAKPMQPIRMIAYHNTAQIVSFKLQANKKCPFCGDPHYVQPPKQEQIKQISQGVQVQSYQFLESRQNSENPKLNEQHNQAKPSHALEQNINFNSY